MTGMLDWVRHALSNKPIHGEQADDVTIDLEAARHPHEPQLEETRPRYFDKRLNDHPDDID